MTKLKFGVIGLGFGKNYVRVLQEMDGVELKAVASRSEGSFQKLSHLLGNNVRRYTKAEELISDPEIDCVVIASPPATHLPFTKLAIKNKKHILVEKPAVTNIKEGGELERVLVGYDRCFMVGHIYLYNDYIRFFKKYINDGNLGEIHYAYFELMVFGPIRQDVECLWEVGAHQLSVFDYLFDAAELIDICGKVVDIAGEGRGDFVSVELTYNNGLVATLIASWFSPQKTKKLIVGGTKGLAFFDDMLTEKKLKIFREDYPGKTTEDSYWFNPEKVESPFVPEIYPKDPLKSELEHFVECVKERKEPLTGIQESSRITRFLDQISKNIKR